MYYSNLCNMDGNSIIIIFFNTMIVPALVLMTGLEFSESLAFVSRDVA